MSSKTEVRTVRYTARNLPRLSPEQTTELARDVVTNVGLLTDKVEVMKSAFLMVLPFIHFTDAAAKLVGAVYGPYSDVVPGRGMNGYPLFYSVRIIHRADMPALLAEMDRMWAALGPGP